MGVAIESRLQRSLALARIGGVVSAAHRGVNVVELGLVVLTPLRAVPVPAHLSDHVARRAHLAPRLSGIGLALAHAGIAVRIARVLLLLANDRVRRRLGRGRGRRLGRGRGRRRGRGVRREVEADRESMERCASVAYPLNRFPRDNSNTVGRVLTFVCGAPDCEEIPPLFGLET